MRKTFLLPGLGKWKRGANVRIFQWENQPQREIFYDSGKIDSADCGISNRRQLGYFFPSIQP